MHETSSAARWRSYITLVLGIVILAFSLWGFGSKFLEFLHIYRGHADGAFAIAPILNYLLASAGFLLILLWAIANGMFHDVERPKYTMLENESQLDRNASAAE